MTGVGLTWPKAKINVPTQVKMGLEAGCVLERRVTCPGFLSYDATPAKHGAFHHYGGSGNFVPGDSSIQ